MVERSAQQLDAVYGALAHPVRRAMLEVLADSPSRVTDLAAPFAMSFAAVSKHVRVLEGAGLVARTVRGREHELALHPEPLADAAAWLAHYRRFWHQRLDLLEARLLDRRRS
jgi:DNA-binding transcriptional ArsR family regulator